MKKGGEAIRAGQSLLEERETKLSLLRSVLKKGEDSGAAEYSFEALIDELNKESPR